MVLVGDVHIAEDRTRYSVLKIKSKGKNAAKYSPRLCHLIETIEWIDSVVEQGEEVVQLGDIVSKATLTAEELSMIAEISPITRKWQGIRGNHGLSIGEHDSDCAVQFSRFYRKPTWETKEIDGLKYNVVYLPYVLEKDRKPLKTYFEDLPKYPTLVLSHNDIKGMNYGGIVEKNGWTIEELESIGDFIINGHIHNFQWLTNKILIAGNVDGENLTESHIGTKHGVWRLDLKAFAQGTTPRECIKFIKNPYAMKFGNVDVMSESDLISLKMGTDDRTVLAITTNEELADDVQSLIDTHLAGGKKIVKASRKAKKVSSATKKMVENHIDKFKRCAIEEFGEIEIIGEI